MGGSSDKTPPPQPIMQPAPVYTPPPKEEKKIRRGSERTILSSNLTNAETNKKTLLGQ